MKAEEKLKRLREDALTLFVDLGDRRNECYGEAQAKEMIAWMLNIQSGVLNLIELLEESNNENTVS